MWLDVKQSAASNQWNVSKVLAAAVGGRDASGRVAVDRLNREGCVIYHLDRVAISIPNVSVAVNMARCC